MHIALDYRSIHAPTWAGHMSPATASLADPAQQRCCRVRLAGFCMKSEMLLAWLKAACAMSHPGIPSGWEGCA